MAKELDVPEESVHEAYILTWRFIRRTINALPLKQKLSEEEFKSLRCNFNIPTIGKLGVTYKKYLAMRKRREYYLKLKNITETEENENKKD